METNEITTTNEEVIITTTEEIETTNSSNGLGMAALGGLVVLGGLMAHKYIIKPIAAKIKNKRESQPITAEVETEVIDVDFVEEPAKAE